jgi:hypothetical protein
MLPNLDNFRSTVLAGHRRGVRTPIPPQKKTKTKYSKQNLKAILKKKTYICLRILIFLRIHIYICLRIHKYVCVGILVGGRQERVSAYVVCVVCIRILLCVRIPHVCQHTTYVSSCRQERVSAYVVCVLILLCVRILHTCPHATYVSAYYMCPNAPPLSPRVSAYVVCVEILLCRLCPHTLICVRMLHTCPHTTYVSAYYIRVCILHMCPHAPPLRILNLSAYYICVLILLYTCPHTRYVFLYSYVLVVGRPYATCVCGLQLQV